jgi:hypothetical protein
MTLPGFPDIEKVLYEAADISIDGKATREFWNEFAQHCQSLLGAIRAYRFEFVLALPHFFSDDALTNSVSAFCSQFELRIRMWWTSLKPEEMVVLQHPSVSQSIYRAEAAVYVVRSLSLSFFLSIVQSFRTRRTSSSSYTLRSSSPCLRKRSRRCEASPIT